MDRKESNPTGLITVLFVSLGAIWFCTFKGGIAESFVTFLATIVFCTLLATPWILAFMLLDNWGKRGRVREDHTNWNFLISLVLNVREIGDLREMLANLYEQDVREYGRRRAEFLYRWRVLRSVGWYAVRFIQKVAGVKFISKLLS